MLDLAYEDAKRIGRLASLAVLHEALVTGAAKRLRPKFMIFASPASASSRSCGPPPPARTCPRPLSAQPGTNRLVLLTISGLPPIQYPSPFD